MKVLLKLEGVSPFIFLHNQKISMSADQDIQVTVISVSLFSALTLSFCLWIYFGYSGRVELQGFVPFILFQNQLIGVKPDKDVATILSPLLTNVHASCSQFE